jgi:uncharacterized iron-regulated membrane protein
MRELTRKILLPIHRMIGLVAGAVFVLVGLSGAILAFREDVDEWLNAPLMRVELPAPPASYRPLDDILAAATAAMPAEARMERLTMPRHARAAAAATYILETDDLDTFLYEMFIDPYSARVTGQRMLLHGDDAFSQPLVPIVMAFHWTLLLGANNAYLIGAIGLLFVASILFGFYLWRPLNGNWRMGLTVKWGASRERVAYDLHRSIGAWCGAILLVMLVTGVAMIFKPMTRNAVALFSTLRADPDFGRSTPLADGAEIGIDAAVAAASTALPDGRLHWILLPSGAEGVYVVGKQSNDEPNRTKTFRNVSVDRFSGAILHVQNREDFSAGERVLEWLYPLHSGEAFGGLGRALALLIGLTPLALYVTGFLRWRHKRRARKLAAR